MKVFGTILAGLRAIILILSLMIFLGVGILLLKLNVLDKNKIHAFRSRYCKIMLWILGIKVIKTGNIPQEAPYLIIANHHSLLDPVILLAYIDASTVGKAEVASYPLIGTGADLSGTIFVDRANKDSRQATKDAIVNTFKIGRNVLVFPEGTVFATTKTAAFKKGSFEMACESNTSVLPVALDYRDPKKDYWTVDSLLDQFFVQFSTWRTEIKLHFHEPIIATDPMVLLEQCQTTLDNTLVGMRKEWDGNYELRITNYD